MLLVQEATSAGIALGVVAVGRLELRAVADRAFPVPITAGRIGGHRLALHVREGGVGLNGGDAVNGRLAGGVALGVAEGLAVGRAKAEIPLAVRALEDCEFALGGAGQQAIETVQRRVLGRGVARRAIWTTQTVALD